ncbi:MAG: type II toxin-antitoxin system prevent-host-death family antitoxin [Parolsenella sp.]|uniref:type II toxin-antitoxin system Phd/YefM family antitoxin n=1 Tax=Parolsenella sp. TaxID=2083006 RepID=UPI002A747D49|nr:type II toxin-antitoxin system prevent-host-death family antitoxin [Parolsenella sp.]MCI5950405.1 type II toxin-antitoxin system prevent-host-death family antitoxin [Coriobacteriaceae bacterium]MDY3292093.1 type II toxin-antitoxin system prevent-host-death family antitoxin [Parolsenella sp.]
MEAVNYSTFRANLRTYLDKTRDDAEPILVTSNDPDSNVVVINIRDYENLVENDYVKSNTYLYEKLLRGREEARAGRVETHELVEDDAQFLARS